MTDPSKPEEPPVPPAPDTVPGVPPAPETPPAPPAPPAAVAVAPAYTPPPAPAAYTAPAAYGQPAYGAQPGYGAPIAPPKTLSITSMVFGIIGVVLGGFIPLSIAAIITGNMGKKREDPSARPFWLTGIITGWVGIGIGILVGLFIIASIVIPLLFVGAAGGFDTYDSY